MEASESAGSIWHHATTSMLDFIFHSAIRPIYWGNSYWIDVLRMQLYRCFCLLISNVKSSVYRSFHTYIRTVSYTHKQHHYFSLGCCVFFFSLLSCRFDSEREMRLEHRRKSFSAIHILGWFFIRLFGFFCFVLRFFFSFQTNNYMCLCMFVCTFSC